VPKLAFLAGRFDRLLWGAAAMVIALALARVLKWAVHRLEQRRPGEERELLRLRRRETAIVRRDRDPVQACITGQTAHLHPDYVEDVKVPRRVVECDLYEAVDLLSQALAHRRESERLAAAARDTFGLRYQEERRTESTP
jgi:hypothetical protein